MTFVNILVIFSCIMPEGISRVSGRAIFGENEITRPAAPSPASDASDASGNYSQEGRKIVNSLDAQIGNQLIEKAKKNDENTDTALQSIIESSKSQDLKKSLKSGYHPEVITAAINEKLRRLQDKSNPSAHTDVSKSVYIDFLKQFLSELKEPSRQVAASMSRVSLPEFNKSN